MPYAFGEYRLDLARRELCWGAEPVAMEPQVFDLLVYLVRHRDRVVGKDDLLQTIWGGRIVSDSALTTWIDAVPRAVGDSGGAQRLIRTFQRKGFRFVAEIEETPEGGGHADGTLAAEAGLVPPLPLPEKPSIVLPFANIGDDPEQQHFADGMNGGAGPRLGALSQRD